tara:strand:+ start:169 stop:1023 length:855 start_codon:yes stop_codon:yes gene_type:complete
MPQAPSLRTDPFFTIHIMHLPTSENVSFEGWVTQFNDSFNSNWSSTPVYGRQDPLPAFENTQRTITLGFDVVSDSKDQAIANLIKINQLIQFLYPMYDKSKRSNQTILNAAPLLGIRWTNLISNAAEGEYLYGYIQGGVSYAPDIGEGGFINKKTTSETQVIPGSQNSTPSPTLQTGESIGAIPQPLASLDYSPSGTGTIVNTFVTQEGSFIPKKVGLSFTFNVLHTHLNGWSKDKKFGGDALLNKKFPNASVIKNNTTISATTTPGNEGVQIIQSLESEALEG